MDSELLVGLGDDNFGYDQAVQAVQELEPVDDLPLVVDDVASHQVLGAFDVGHVDGVPVHRGHQVTLAGAGACGQEDGQ